MLRKQNDTFLIGFMIGVTIPVLGHFCIENIFDLLTASGYMDESSASTITKRLKTITILSICCNILPAQISTNKRYTKILQGIVTATLVYAALWVLHFYFGIGN